MIRLKLIESIQNNYQINNVGLLKGLSAFN